MADDYKYSREEQETIILYDQANKTAEIYTYHPALVRKLDKACISHPDLYKFTGEECGARLYTIPKKYISVRVPSLKVKTPEQIEAMRERMANMRNKL